eukprot:TRINITY_DN67867_c0_g1_i1.p1 TRINITY_DN67867_c0_g1~~TRINITY_DN67867_c0_g1_i1.p1  ORF type:complete len:376 (+),score=54.75 TRINITY_DN67867_c0_g1_i1:45-1172(+)
MYQKLLDKLAKWMLPAWVPTGHTVHLGLVYDASKEDQKEAFFKDFRSRLQFTYRKDWSSSIALASGRLITSDSGWGCMLRTMQMMLAQCFLTVELGRDWSFECVRDLEVGSTYLEIISCFLDTPTALLSLHNFVTVGQRLFGKEPSEWFGPTSAAKAAGRLVSMESDSSNGETPSGVLLAGGETPRLPSCLRRVACVVFEDTIFKSRVLECFERSEGIDAVVVLVCRRLGLNSFNLGEYQSGVKACFEMPEFQGLASGDSGSSAHFFVATHDDDYLLYLDPHTVQPSLESVSGVVPGSDSAAGLRPAAPLALRWSRLNPSVCFGFLVRQPAEFLGLCEKLEAGDVGKVFEILDSEPSYAERAEVNTEDDDMVVLE